MLEKKSTTITFYSRADSRNQHTIVSVLSGAVQLDCDGYTLKFSFDHARRIANAMLEICDDEQARLDAMNKHEREAE